MKSRKLISYALFLLFISGCGQPDIKYEENLHSKTKPLWLIKEDSLDNYSAVGFSGPSFQGMYIQRAEALSKAREILSQKISSSMTVVYKNKVKVNNQLVAKKYQSSITNISKLLLKNTYQKDAYIDEKANLYVLLVVDRRSHSNLQLPVLSLKQFSIDPLLKRRCYGEEVLKNIQTKSLMYRGKPIWFYRPTENVEGVSSIGIAERTQTSTYASQKRAAIALAKLGLIQRIEMKIDSYDKLSEIILHDEVGQMENWKTSIKTFSKVDQVKLLDLWMDPQQCEIYVWISNK